jgi:hypothetical protein
VVHVIGDADEFWRLRIVCVGTIDPSDLDWADDVLYRRQSAVCGDAQESWNVEVVKIDDPERVCVLGTFSRDSEAQEKLHEIEEDLQEMSRSQFESTYLAGMRP